MAAQSSVGRSLPRVEGGEKVAGLTRYASDVQLPGMLHVRLVLSPHAHARVVAVDARDAAALPGVVRVFTELPITSEKIVAPSD
jgi:CO/xanthine dehydrogenase Mo-binding subunit